MLTLAALLIVGGWLGERGGQRRVMIIGLIGRGIAVNESHTVAFHWAMVVNAIMAFTGGLVAAATIRDPSSHPG